MAESYGRTMHLLNEVGEGEIFIADDVIGHIAGIAALEIDGVIEHAPGITKKRVRVAAEDRAVTVEIAICIKYNYSIPEVCKAVQDRIKTVIEDMTELKVESVNVKVVGVDAN